MLTYGRGVFIAALSALSLGACQVLSGLSGLDAEASGGPGVGGVGGVGGNAVAGPGGTGAGGDAFAGCEDNPTDCVETFIRMEGARVDILGVVPGYILWAMKSESGQAAIWRASIEERNFDTMLSELSLSHFATYKNLFYWIDTSGTSIAVKAQSGISKGEPSVTIATEVKTEKAEGFAVGEGHAFWSLKGSSGVRWSTGQGEAVGDFVTGSTGEQAFTTLVFNGISLYWNKMPPDGEIRRKDVAMSGEDGLVVPTGDSTVTGMAVDETFLYWTTQGGSVSTVNMMPKNDSGIAGMDLGGTPNTPTQITADAEYVYWVDLNVPDCALGIATVKRAPKDPKKAGTVDVASGLTCPSNFVQDETYIYIGSGDTIFRFPKKTNANSTGG